MNKGKINISLMFSVAKQSRAEHQMKWPTTSVTMTKLTETVSTPSI